MGGLLEGHADLLAERLRALYEHAGSPVYATITAFGAAQQPPINFADATLSNWLTGRTVPASKRAFSALVAWLEFRAKRDPDHQTVDARAWEGLRSAAWAERQARRRPLLLNPVHDGPSDTENGPELGRLIAEWDPLDLEVHPAGDGPGRGLEHPLPGYVRRAHDDVLAKAVRQAMGGRSSMAVLVGSSSTGKTRACWEAVQPLAEHGWRLWHPFNPTRVDAALAGLAAVEPHTVVWLNEAQHYLDAGEELAAAVHALLTDPGRGPVLVLGTLWPEYDLIYSARPEPGDPDPHARTRELLGGRRISVPDAFDEAAINEARLIAQDGDQLLTAALERDDDGRITQLLAGAPELLRRYKQATSPARALLHAAVDARRLGVGLHLPLGFLADAVAGYLSPGEYDALTDDWLERALVELADPVHGNLAPMRRVRGRRQSGPPGYGIDTTGAAPGPQYRLADYLEEHGRRTRGLICPPASFWQAAHAYLTDPNDLMRLSDAANSRYRLQWEHALQLRAAEAGDIAAMHRIAIQAEMVGSRAKAEQFAFRIADSGDYTVVRELAALREKAGDQTGAQALLQRAVDGGDIEAVYRCVSLRERTGDPEGAERLAIEAAETDDAGALRSLAALRVEAKDYEGARPLIFQAAEHGEARWLLRLARLLETIKDPQGAETLLLQAAELGGTAAMRRLAEIREASGDRENVDPLLQRAAAAGDTEALVWLAIRREMAGDHEVAEQLAQSAAEAGETRAFLRLAGLREDASDVEGAEALLWRAADAGDIRALVQLAEMRERAGDRVAAERLAIQAAEPVALLHLALRWERAGYQREAERFVFKAAEVGFADGVFRLAGVRERAGEHEAAMALLLRLAEQGNAASLARLAVRHEALGDRETAEQFAIQAAEAGDRTAFTQLCMLRERAGDHDAAERIAFEAAGFGVTRSVLELAEARERAGDDEGAMALLLRLAEQGNTAFLVRLAVRHEALGDRETAEQFAIQAAEAGDTSALTRLCVLRERAGDRDAAEWLAIRAADAGDAAGLREISRLRDETSIGDDYVRAVILNVNSSYSVFRYGLDPDGTPTAPWW